MSLIVEIHSGKYMFLNASSKCIDLHIKHSHALLFVLLIIFILLKRRHDSLKYCYNLLFAYLGLCEWFFVCLI